MVEASFDHSVEEPDPDDPAGDAHGFSQGGRGLLRREGQAYRYAPTDDSLRADIEDLAGCYSRQLVDVTQLVHSKPGAIVRSFADAFRFRKD